ncbi:hypothetical protein SLE2022_117260 [Rubroshorea leprosula]
MAKLSAARVIFWVALMALAMSSLARPLLLHKRIESRLLLLKLGYDEKSLGHYKQVFASTAGGDRLSPSGPDPEHHSHPPKMS